MIEIENVTRRYGKKTAVDRLSLTIPSGELFACLGHNGAGKTTCIKMMVGLLQPDGGALRLCGHDVVREPRLAAAVTGYVPDQPYLYDKLSGREFLRFVARMYGFDRRETEAEIERQIEAFRLHEFIDHLAESYSHGMRQRLSFAAAILHRPKVLIVDEPMVGLDPRSARSVRELLRQQADSGTTVFMSTHTLNVAEEIADRIGVLESGKLLFLGTVAELREKMALNDQLSINDPQALQDQSLEGLYLRLTDSPEADESPGSQGET